MTVRWWSERLLSTRLAGDGFASPTSTVFLLAASGPTTIYDASPNGLTVSRFGSATATTAETNFSGKYSISLDGVDSYLRLPNDPVFSLGTGDFLF